MKPLIISLGHRFRQDDGFGPTVLDALRLALEERADYIESVGDTAALLDVWRDRDKVFLIDACYDDDSPAGQIFRLDALTESLPADNPVASSHALNIASAIELGRLTKALPQLLTMYCAVGKDFAHGTGLSPPVMVAAERVVASITCEFNTGEKSCMNNH